MFIFLALLSTVFSQDKVVVEFYGEALWPACRSFVTGPLNDTLTAEGVFDVVDYRFFPWGNAFYNSTECPYASYSHDGIHCWLDRCGGKSPPKDCFDGTALCQHGSQECLENLVEACAKYKNPDDVMAVSVFAWCVESSEKLSIETCADMAGLDSGEISDCVSGSDGILANQAVAAATVALDPPHTGTPWVLVNGKQADTSNLLREVCRAYNGKKPRGCKLLRSTRRNATEPCIL